MFFLKIVQQINVDAFCFNWKIRFNSIKIKEIKELRNQGIKK